MKLSTLYERSSTGKITEWTIEVEKNKFRTITGFIDGKKVTSAWTECSGKNEGKANATTPEEQALSEATATHRKRKEHGAFENVGDVDQETFFEPMLANKLEKRIHKLKFPVYSNFKLDGCLSYDTLISTDIGDVAIGNIVEKGIVCNIKTYNERTKKTEFKKIINRMKNGIDIKDKNVEWFEILMDDGRRLKITGNHLIYLPKLKCWRRVDELEEGDKLLNIF